MDDKSIEVGYNLAINRLARYDVEFDEMVVRDLLSQAVDHLLKTADQSPIDGLSMEMYCEQVVFAVAVREACKEEYLHADLWDRIKRFIEVLKNGLVLK